MSPPAAPEQVDRVLIAARGLARRHGVGGEPAVLSTGGANVIVGFDGGPAAGLVVRSPARPGELPGQEVGDPWRLRAEVAFGAWLAARGAPVVPPADPAADTDADPLPPGPHAVGGSWLTVWRRGQEADGRGAHRSTPGAAGAALRELHAAARGYPGAGRLVRMAPVRDDLAAVLDRLADRGGPADGLLPRLRQAWQAVGDQLAAASTGLDVQALHGDAHPRNLLFLHGRLVWNDLEDCCSGPVTWDVGVLRATSVLDGAAAVAAYGWPVPGVDPALEPWVRARELQRVVWTAARVRTREERAAVDGLLDGLTSAP